MSAELSGTVPSPSVLITLWRTVEQTRPARGTHLHTCWSRIETRVERWLPMNRSLRRRPHRDHSPDEADTVLHTQHRHRDEPALRVGQDVDLLSRREGDGADVVEQLLRVVAGTAPPVVVEWEERLVPHVAGGLQLV